MSMRSYLRRRSLFSHSVVIFVVFIAVFGAACAQESGGDDSKAESKSEVRDLGRRSKIFLGKVNKDVAQDDSSSEWGDLSINVDAPGLGIFDALFASFSMILVTEIGDETFIIAALMAMRHPKAIVLSGALCALIVMTVLSTALGRIVPNLISRKHTNSAATILYAFFGLRLLYIAWRSDPKGSQKKEIEEVEEKLETNQGKTAYRRFLSRFLTPIFLESFILTFLAEWGDRSQIATIALATHKNAIGVAIGATIGHTLCTSLAVVGGSILASNTNLFIGYNNYLACGY
uniref:GDT1 family protein n=1 Tax=Kalanchoe fedtschenkoi TaxID=63787 RepID=A0A7N0ZTH7_KALFE